MRVAAEKVVAELGGMGSVDVSGLQQQITDLHEHLHAATTATAALTSRVEALEAAAKVPVRGVRRKTDSE